MELLVFGHAGAKVLVFPSRQGRFYDYENFGLVDALKPSIEGGCIRLYCVDALDSESLYCNSAPPPARIVRHQEYERYILDEVVGLMRCGDGVDPLIVHGCSIGAYHAMTLALRHPEVFCKVVALSGRYDLTRSVGPFPDLFDGYYGTDVYYITPNHFVPNLSDPAILSALRRMEIIMAVGAEDPFQESNFVLSQALLGKDVPHQFVVWPGEAHRARYWRQMVRLYL